jgi:hypothetical protein
MIRISLSSRNDVESSDFVSSLSAGSIAFSVVGVVPDDER